MDGPLGAQHKLLVSMPGLLRIEAFLPSWRGLVGRRPGERTALARAFAEFADSALALRLHEALIQETRADHLVGHISRDSTAVEAGQKPAKPEQPAPAARPKRKRGAPAGMKSAPPGRHVGSCANPA